MNERPETGTPSASGLPNQRYEGGPTYRRAARSVVAVLSVTAYTLLGPFGYLLFALLYALPTRRPHRRARFLQAIFHRAFAFMHHWLRWARIMRYDPRKLRGALPDGPCIIIANHPSLTDTTAIIGTFGGMVTMVKPAIFRSWMLKPVLKASGQFEGPSSDPLDMQRIIAEGRSRLDAGFKLLIFPEGTRSPEGGLHRFGRTAFTLACQADLPVVPLVIRYRPVFLSKRCRMLWPPARLPELNIAVLDAVEPTRYQHDSREMRDAVLATYHQHLAPLQA